jgi:hypothetical protein
VTTTRPKPTRLLSRATVAESFSTITTLPTRILSGFSLETLVKSSVSACPFREMVRFGWSTALSADRERITVALCPTVVW